MTRPHVAGLDLSLTRTGIARVDGTLATLTLPPSLKDYRRHRAMAAAVAREISPRARPLDLVVIEGYDPHPRGHLALIRAAEIGGMVRAWLTELDVEWVDVPPSKLKKFATGRGNANKDGVLAAAINAGAGTERGPGGARLTYDEADAYWLRQYGLNLGQPRHLDQH